ncbi:hypothetical protein CAL12_01975 [Bordetella genomosp. 8]|uniref:Uncharacterized protein n=1 Tax=Bordetella genomosp. 8 TaxID=1416806 RepID=A0A1W6YF88_9BORD|nr:hypothetical protein [Bordetella genomosp. 8]ARP79711.1 hypothetical protein CAL12_01975 [Bordetella genomosp. 8]
MTQVNNISSGGAHPGLLGDFSAIARDNTPYSTQPGRRKASQRRFAPALRGGEGRKLVDGKHQEGRVDARRGAAAIGVPGSGQAPMASTNATPGVAPRTQSAPAGLFSMDDGGQSGDVLPDRAVMRKISAASSASTGAAPLRRVLACVLDALGSACDKVYAGVNQTGRELQRGYLAVHGAWASLGRHAADARGGAPSATGRRPYVPLPPIDRSNVAMMAGVEADLIERALRRSATGLEFSGENLTYRNLFYLIRDKTYRLQQDEAGRGLRAQAADDGDCLMRRVATAINNARDPFGMLSNGIEGAADPRVFKPLDGTGVSKFATARAQYLDYRDAHYPDFAPTYQRLAQFGDGLTNRIVEQTIEARRAACQAQGIEFDEDALIDDAMVLNPGDRHPVTARQFSDDLRRMRVCAAELAATLAQRTSFQA